MKYNLQPFEAQGKVLAVSSKSYAHRIIICSALSKGITKINNLGNSLDVLATLSCVQALGAKVDIKDGYVLIEGIEKVNKNALLDFNESGSTMRFMIPVSASIGANSTFTGRGKLLSRPNQALYSELARHGVQVVDNKINGKLTAGDYQIDSSISSQYVSGLLMSLPMLNGKSKLTLLNSVVSANYISMTLEVLKQFGVEYKINDNQIELVSQNGFVSPKEITVEGDWSSGASILTLGALSDKGVTVKGLNANSTQSDRKIIEILNNVGANVIINGDEVTVSKGRLNAIKTDLTTCPDLAPVLSSVLAYCKGTSVVKGVDRLKIKESDRLGAIINNLALAGIETKYDSDTLYVYGASPKGANFLGYNDHRMVMSACTLSSKAQGNSTITDVEAVAKSYKDYFIDLKKLNGVFYE